MCSNSVGNSVHQLPKKIFETIYMNDAKQFTNDLTSHRTPASGEESSVLTPWPDNAPPVELFLLPSTATFMNP